MLEIAVNILVGLQLRKIVSIITDLGKFRITFFVAVTTAFGYILFSNSLSVGVIFSALGVFFMASGASALNQVQEYKFDLLMNRTKNRPIPSGQISLLGAKILGSLFLILGVAILFLLFGILPAILGLFTFIWYNLIYTPLKKINSFAIIPGSIVGAIPPVIGWTSAGGYLFEPTIMSTALFFFIWQIPHFWLLLLIYSDDYKKAGFPVLTDKFSHRFLSRISFLWIIALGFASFQMLIFDSSFSSVSFILSSILFLILIFLSSSLIYKNLDRKLYLNNFYFINIYVLMIILLLTIDKLSN